jgi:hypothetical protein
MNFFTLKNTLSSCCAKHLRKLILSNSILLIVAVSLKAQNVAINSTGISANTSSILDVQSTTKGLLLPRMSKAQRLAIINPANGLVVYQNSPDSLGLYYYDTPRWNWILGSETYHNINWRTNGNSNINGSTNFIGTIDNNPIIFKTNNVLSGFVTPFSSNNLALGYGALNTYSSNLLSGFNNIGIGTNALNATTNGYSNIGVGNAAMNSNISGRFNVALGSSSMYFNTIGEENIAIGYQSLYNNKTATRNVAIGSNALYNAIGNYNIAMGFGALTASKEGVGNVAIGCESMPSSTTGSYNTAMGMQAMYNNTTGSNNVAIGYYALANPPNEGTGNNNIAIGYYALVPSLAASNQIQIGNTYITYAGTQVAWSITSDSRWKNSITPINIGLDLIKKLRPVSYYRNNDSNKKIEYGFIAQEVASALEEIQVKNSGMISIDDAGMYAMRYNDIVAPMVKAIQEQEVLIEQLRKENQIMQKEINKILQKLNFDKK